MLSSLLTNTTQGRVQKAGIVPVKAIGAKQPAKQNEGQ